MTLSEVAFVATAAVSGGFLVAVVVGALKDAFSFVLKQVADFLFVKMQLQSEETAQLVAGFLRTRCRGIGLGKDEYSHKRRGVPGVGIATVFYRSAVRSFGLYWYRGAPVFLTPYAESGDKNTNNKQMSIRFLRGTINVKRLLSDAGVFFDTWTKEHKNRSHTIVRLSGGSKHDEDKIQTKEELHSKASFTYDAHIEPVNFIIEELEPVERDNALDALSQTSAHKILRRDFQFWLRHSQWYRERKLPWRRGYILHGPPGTGKTSLIRALCEDEDVAIIVMDLSSMTNNQFMAAWEYARRWSPRAILLEDFDSVFECRRNISKLAMLDFSCVLNAIDGIEQEDGMLLFVTTNHPENIDPALGQPLPDGRTTRPGRLDVSIDIPALEFEGRLKISKRIVENDSDARKLALEGKNESPAQFIERCKQFALKTLWENEDLTFAEEISKVRNGSGQNGVHVDMAEVQVCRFANSIAEGDPVAFKGSVFEQGSTSIGKDPENGPTAPPES